MKKIFLSLFLITLAFMPLRLSAQVEIKETTIDIPTYLVGDPEKDPYFFTGRTYQGAAGHIYPYPIYDILTDDRVERQYKYLTVENEYTHIGVLPEIGGRILDAQDKQSGYYFFYRQHVIRPALIGMIGSWISGGVEWNVPHHHRASSTLNTGYEIVENPDGSKTIWVGETELRQRLKWNVGLTIFPGKSYVEATFQIQNRTLLMQSFLYWANVSVHCNENYQVQFPPETVYGTTHSKTEYNDWPYGIKDSEGNVLDGSWWKNYPYSNSTFAVNYTDDFLVGYDFGKDAGTAHLGNHHVEPGKKFFLWGTGSVWNEMLTEEDGAYLELMVGTYSDNQPDYSWLGPNEVRETKQYWYTIKGIGGAKNVTLQGAVNMERKSPTSVMVGFNATQKYDNAKVIFKAGDKVIAEKKINIDPDTPFKEDFNVDSSVKDEDLFAGLYDKDGNELVSYQPKPKPEEERPHPADRPKQPEEYDSIEELLLAGQRLDEFHNARLSPVPYYEEVLKRDSLESRANVNLGIYYARQSQWAKAEKYLQRAYKRLTGLHFMPEVDKTGVLYQTNPKDGEMFYYLGVVSQQLGKQKEAEAYYWKSTWYPGFQSPAFLYLAEMKSVAGDYEEALDLIDRSLEYSGRSTLSKFVKSFILTKLGREEEAKTLLKENIAFDRLDFLSLVEIARLNNDYKALADVISHMGIPLQEVLEVSTYYGAVGGYDEAVRLLDFAMANGSEFSSTPMQKNAVEPFTASPLLNYMAGYYSNLAGKTDKAKEYYAKAVTMSPDYCFPSRVEEEAMLRDAIAVNPDDSKAHYYLGNLLYFRDRKDEAISEWKESSRLNPNYGMVFRNLGFAANNYLSDKEAAADYYRKAIEADRTDPKFFTELDIIEEAQKVPSKERLAFMDKNKATVFKSDDATSRLVYLYVENGQYDKALNILESRHFRVWEGGKTAYTPFVDAHLLSGLDQLAKHKNQKALEHFLAAGTFPRNLETNELSTGPIVAKVAYFQGLAYKAFGQTEDASKAFQRCVDAANDGSDGRLDESRYFLAMAYKEMGNEAESKKVLSDVQQKLDDLNKAGSAAAVDIYSKFGEDGSSDVVKARNIYVQGLVCLAEGRKSEAHEYFAKSLELDSSNVWASYFLKASR